ncbi:hypothetical protein ACFSQ7_13205 [Paenibacillus rhizoplanae]
MKKRNFLQEPYLLNGCCKNERGYELIYDQYTYIREHPADRYFLYRNGWDGLLSNDTLDLLWVLLVVLLVAPVYCYEYEKQDGYAASDSAKRDLPTECMQDLYGVIVGCVAESVDVIYGVCFSIEIWTGTRELSTAELVLFLLNPCTLFEAFSVGDIRQGVWQFIFGFVNPVCLRVYETLRVYSFYLHRNPSNPLLWTSIRI